MQIFTTDYNDNTDDRWGKQISKQFAISVIRDIRG